MSRGHDSDTKPGVDRDPRVAPADLEDLRAFLNSDNRYYGVDMLQLPERRQLFFARALVDHDVAGIDERGWARLVELRDAIRALVAGEPGAPERLTTVAATHAVRVAFEQGADSVQVRLVPAGTRAELPIVASVLTAVQAATLDGRLSRLRICQRPDCGWCYYDGSKNRSARWCTADPCGDVMKARAYRSRNRAAESSAGS
jgi:predicted RNA-binding Zn ribbon-like protein